LALAVKFEAEFDAGVAQGVEIPDLGLDGGEVGHKFLSYQCSVLEGRGGRNAKGGSSGVEEPPFARVGGMFVSGGGSELVSGFRGGGIGLLRVGLWLEGSACWGV
jgi:hypothetical protein